jgi:hypothetical protein
MNEIERRSDTIKRSYRVVALDGHSQGEAEKYFMLGFGLYEYEHKDGTYPLIFRRPNLISMYMHSAQFCFEKAIAILEEDLEPTLKENEEGKYLTFEVDKDTEKVHDFLEELLKALVFSYSSMEAFANRCLYHAEDLSTDERRKLIVERDLSQKLKEDIPQLYNVHRVHTREKYKKAWSDFKKLEQLRHDMIHSKGGKKNDQDFISRLYMEFVVHRVHESIEKLMQGYIEVLPDIIEFPSHLANDPYRLENVEQINQAIDKGEI